MIKLISSLLVVVMLAGNVDYETNSLSYTTGQRWNTVNKPKVYVSVEFRLLKEDFQQHPFLVNVFSSAVSEWATKLPIRTTFYFDGASLFAETTKDRAYVINVGFVDLQAIPYKYEDAVVGIWRPSVREVLFDLDYFQKSPDEFYAVALHELGHVFGLPHIVNRNELGSTGYLVLQESDARDFVMYPKSFLDRPQDKLSDIEIEYAIHQVMYMFSTDQLAQQAECTISVDKP